MDSKCGNEYEIRGKRQKFETSMKEYEIRSEQQKLGTKIKKREVPNIGMSMREWKRENKNGK